MIRGLRSAFDPERSIHHAAGCRIRAVTAGDGANSVKASASPSRPTAFRGSMARKGNADLIAIGRKFLANPDLPDRLRTRTGLNGPTHRRGVSAIGRPRMLSVARSLLRKRRIVGKALWPHRHNTWIDRRQRTTETWISIPCLEQTGHPRLRHARMT